MAQQHHSIHYLIPCRLRNYEQAVQRRIVVTQGGILIVKQGNNVGYIESNLLPDEQIVYLTQLHWIIFFKSFFVSAVGVTLLAVSSSVSAQTISIEGQNIYYQHSTGSRRQITSAGLDSEAVLSPDGKLIAFVRRTPGKKMPTGTVD